MSTAAEIRNIASEARIVIARGLDDAEILKGLSKVCREKGIDWTQLKALVKAQEQDHRDGGKRVEKIVKKADYAAAYADILAGKMNNNHDSCSSSMHDGQQAASANAGLADAILPSSATSIPDDLSIPPFLDRRGNTPRSDPPAPTTLMPPV